MIITPNDVKNSTRPIARNIDDKRILIYIEEAEQMDLRPAIGDVVYIAVDDPLNGKKYETLLNGGKYVTKSGDIKFFKGLKMALCYYVYGRFTKNNNITIARNNNIKKDSEYSSSASTKEVFDSYADAFLIGEKYLKDAIEYISENKDLFPMYESAGNKISRTKYRVIGL